MFIFGIIINFQMLLSILVRPVLWSTTNTFIAFLLASNLLYLTFQSLLDQENEVIIPDDNMILYFLEYNFFEEFKSLNCSAKFISQFLHGAVSLLLLVGVVFIRSMMVKHAQNISTNNFKAHHARQLYWHHCGAFHHQLLHWCCHIHFPLSTFPFGICSCAKLQRCSLQI